MGRASNTAGSTGWSPSYRACPAEGFRGGDQHDRELTGGVLAMHFLARGFACSFFAALALGVLSPPARCQGVEETERHQIRVSAEAPFLVSMALCHSRTCLAPFKPAAGASRNARIVYFARLFALEPDDQAAARGLLSSLPVGGDSYSDVISLGTALWPGETVAQMLAGDEIGESLSREAARAAVLDPLDIWHFLRYSLVAISNPHDKIGSAAARVCRLRHSQLIAGLSQLPKGARAEFKRYVLDPKGCRQIHKSEAD